MRAVLQRVKKASVVVENEIVGKIGKGILVLLGVGHNDTENDIKWLADKIMNLRIFEDENDKMNLSLLDIKGEILVVSQFTLYGDCRKGRRPSYSNAAKPDKANEYYEKFMKYIEDNYNIKVERGIFQAEMEVELINDGPVTLLLDSEKTF
ncbi:D-tyrosyl-tRNA(Tyr) deacylase [Marinitoga sp. 1135]|uniref:D-aminoacyl-tRNA deacylase n=1 Tax=Marinitoga piezophila (strain DSM 14283 / JCM 11233 / KA3) TaxID=443254 RepID=H2J331_MARPK|nr:MULTISPECIES: D-aminoacyl-tRNA deacylase [Marinitoga]AEX84549.1 D-tyrosyl-tRNA(Tyr) deacylase [Marinitoga piezophila KA3]APT75075.1 D-tyrosyl-tRNA(Tyr) deacylase [Marinitoga sp. 1137]NUU94848.1 D-tyrosyl-tRNA(Tyr) deacylase [Marinitoga sp. 1135]